MIIDLVDEHLAPHLVAFLDILVDCEGSDDLVDKFLKVRISDISYQRAERDTDIRESVDFCVHHDLTNTENCDSMLSQRGEDYLQEEVLRLYKAGRAIETEKKQVDDYLEVQHYKMVTNT